MPTLDFAVTVAAPLARVWAFHEDVVAALPALSPAGDDVRVESADVPVRAGSRICINARGPLGRRIRWVARIVEHVPPHAVVFGEEARFVDVQERGPFASWRHEHEFEAVDAKTTRCVDRVTYRVPLGPIGWIADLLLVRPKLVAMFRYRHEQLRRLLGNG
ncbi:MAG TPA: SRPBCC family protein [Tepidisphaeraceae bacterium]|nr:SRPBCC family protein [Tepidisphaeraceae bacterium]